MPGIQTHLIHNFNVEIFQNFVHIRATKYHFNTHVSMVRTCWFNYQYVTNKSVYAIVSCKKYALHQPTGSSISIRTSRPKSPHSASKASLLPPHLSPNCQPPQEIAPDYRQDNPHYHLHNVRTKYSLA